MIDVLSLRGIIAVFAALDVATGVSTPATYATAEDARSYRSISDWREGQRVP